MEEAGKSFREAFDFHIKGSAEHGDTLPKYVLNNDYELVFKLGASAMLHMADCLISHSAISKATGINEKQLSHYLTGRKIARDAQNKKTASCIVQIFKQIDAFSCIG